MLVSFAYGGAFRRWDAALDASTNGGAGSCVVGITQTRENAEWIVAQGVPAPERRAMMRWLLLGFVFLLMACGGQGNPLANTEWRLVALGDADAPAEVAGGNPTAKFTTATDLTGWTGCNAYGAGYRVQGLELRLDHLTWTQAGCPSMVLFQQEQLIQESLVMVEGFEVLDERLTLHSAGGQALVFERVGK